MWHYFNILTVSKSYNFTEAGKLALNQIVKGKGEIASDQVWIKFFSPICESHVACRAKEDLCDGIKLTDPFL